MTKLEQKQQEYIDLLRNQVIDLSMMSKIELGDDVIIEALKLQSQIEDIKPSVPFIDEVEEFNAVMGKPNNAPPTDSTIICPKCRGKLKKGFCIVCYMKERKNG